MKKLAVLPGLAGAMALLSFTPMNTNATAIARSSPDSNRASVPV